MIYPESPFAESIRIAEYLRQHTTEATQSCAGIRAGDLVLLQPALRDRLRLCLRPDEPQNVCQPNAGRNDSRIERGPSQVFLRLCG